MKFWRQKPINNFIVDFYCPKLKLVIEVGADSHFTDSGLVYDEEGTEGLWERKVLSRIAIEFREPVRFLGGVVLLESWFYCMDRILFAENDQSHFDFYKR